MEQGSNLDFHGILGLLLEPHKELTILKIGANDGLSSDSLGPLILNNPTWRVLMVEPTPSALTRLRATFGLLPNIVIAETAIAEHDGKLKLHTVTADGPVAVFDVLTSSNPDLVKRNCNEAFYPFIREIEVDCVTLDTLFNEYPRFEHADVVQIDTEGMDWIILRQLLDSYTQRRPRVIAYETRLLSEEDKAASHKALFESGYSVIPCLYDTLAIHFWS